MREGKEPAQNRWEDHRFYSILKAQKNRKHGTGNVKSWGNNSHKFKVWILSTKYIYSCVLQLLNDCNRTS